MLPSQEILICFGSVDPLSEPGPGLSRELGPVTIAVHYISLQSMLRGNIH